MCTLIVLHRCVSGAPLMVAANRDEFYERPAAGPGLLEVLTPPGGSLPEGGAVLAPRDLRAGGTWLGVNAQGVFAAITNRPTEERDTSRRSRGLLVMDSLRWRSAERSMAAIGALRGADYNPFNLFVSDGERAYTAIVRDEREGENGIEIEELEPGAHVIGNAEPNDLEHAKTARILEQAQRAAAQAPTDALSTLAEVCAEHEVGAGPLEDVCIHLDGYGTRSSMLLSMAEAGASGLKSPESSFQYSEEAPCVQSHRDMTALLHALGRRAWRGEEETLARKAS